MSQMKVYDGASHVDPSSVKYWNGSAWVQAMPKRWTGSAWEELMSYFSSVYAFTEDADRVGIEKVNVSDGSLDQGYRDTTCDMGRKGTLYYDNSYAVTGGGANGEMCQYNLEGTFSKGWSNLESSRSTVFSLTTTFDDVYTIVGDTDANIYQIINSSGASGWIQLGTQPAGENIYGLTPSLHEPRVYIGAHDTLETRNISDGENYGSAFVYQNYIRDITTYGNYVYTISVEGKLKRFIYNLSQAPDLNKSLDTYGVGICISSDGLFLYYLSSQELVTKVRESDFATIGTCALSSLSSAIGGIDISPKGNKVYTGSELALTEINTSNMTEGWIRIPEGIIKNVVSEN